jgi:hypothetical protein
MVPTVAGALRALLRLALPTVLAAQGRISGVVFDSLRTRSPLAGATVHLEGLSAVSTTDELGRFRLSNVPAGRYIATFFHPWLDSIRTAAPAVFVEVRDGVTTTFDIATPSWRTMSAYLCGAPQDSATAVVLGRSTAAGSGVPLVEAMATAEWFEISFGDGAGVRRGTRALTAVADSSGEFILCGVPSDIEVELVVTAGARTTGPIPLTLQDEPIAWRDLSLGLPEESARLRVMVRRESGELVPGAAVGIRGAPASGMTDEEGRAVLNAVPVGTQALMVRAIGTAPVTQVVDLVPGENGTREVRLSAAAIELATVAVHGLRPNPEVAAFERRRRAGSGYFLDGDDLRRHGRGSAVLATIPGVRLPLDGSGGRPMPYFRGNDGQLCAPTVMIDGASRVRMDGWELDDLMRIAVRVEVYTRPMLVPADLAVPFGCGVIGIWTR